MYAAQRGKTHKEKTMPNKNYWRIMNPSTYGDAQVTLLATDD